MCMHHTSAIEHPAPAGPSVGVCVVYSGYMCICILHTGTLSSPDTNGAEESFIVSEVS